MKAIEIPLRNSIEVPPHVIIKHIGEEVRRKIGVLTRTDHECYLIDNSNQLVGITDYGHHRGGTERQVIEACEDSGQAYGTLACIEEARELLQAWKLIEKLILQP